MKRVEGRDFEDNIYGKIRTGGKTFWHESWLQDRFNMFGSLKQFLLCGFLR